MLKFKMTFMKMLQNVENFKLYHIIILSVILFFLIMLNSFYQVRNEMESLIEQNRIAVSKDIEYTILSWLEERMNNLENSIKYMDKDAVMGNEKKLKDFISIFLDQNKVFDLVQILVPNYYLYVNTNKSNDYRTNPHYRHQPSNLDPLSTKWYIDTKERRETTITIMSKHVHLLQRSVNICSPVIHKEKFQGVMCGVFRADSIFNKIKKLQLPHQAYYFIVNAQGKLLSSSNMKIEASDIEEHILKKINFNTDKPQMLHFKNHTITLSKMKHFEWVVGIGVDKTSIYEKSFQKFFFHGLSFFLGFLVVALIVFSIFEFMRYKIERKQKEYEYLLEHRSRVEEIGELISGFNHQLRQPVNSLSLMLSNIMQLSKNRALKTEILEENVQACQKSIQLIDKTIIMFRNFYRCNQDVTTFQVHDCIKAILHIVFTDFVRSNINFSIDENRENHITIHSIENFIQQIILVLIQNSKDALLEEEEKQGHPINKKILIRTKAEHGKVIIDIIDWGTGIEKHELNTLFSTAKNSKKKQGSGIGLFFAKKLAQDKLKGNIVLENPKNPTIFRLTFAQYLNQEQNDNAS